MAIDIHAILREAEEQKAARAEQLPTEQDCIRMMVQCRLRLLDLGWRDGMFAPREGEFEGINAGYRGPVICQHLGSGGFFTADGGDWWPTPRPIVFRAKKGTS